MSCTYKTAFSPVVLPASASSDAWRPAVWRTIIVIADAFQEALAMRRAARRTCFLGDE